MSGDTRETSARTLGLTLLALLVLAAVSLALRYAHLGTAGYAVALGIALVKAVLVAVSFMEIAEEKPSAGLAFVAGIALFAVLLAFVLADVVTRTVPPLSSPPGVAPREQG